MYKDFKVKPRTDFENVPLLKDILLWEKGFEGNNFKDSPFVGFYDEEGTLYMYPEIEVGLNEEGESLKPVAWAEIGELVHE